MLICALMCPTLGNHACTPCSRISGLVEYFVLKLLLVSLFAWNCN